ncbi:thioredoxin fold domain-containing protein [Kriegella sp. EG-1]|nr:thioredoxin fold domain-containing protein [Flavobacteriaceae bacterium EG-1]
MKIKYCTFFVLVFSALNGFSQEWKDSYTTALSCAKDQNKPIILVFSGSDWCAPCIKLDKEIWQSEIFNSYAHENYILYRADFPRKKSNKLAKELETQNKSLAALYNPNGHFPLVVVLNKDEKVLGKTGYKKLAPNKYVSHLNSFIK